MAAPELLLGVNIDHVATLRQARHTQYPQPVHAALIAETAGADSITVHLREDRRHIQDRDLTNLKDALTIALNLEMAVTEEMQLIAVKLQPAFCCLVPERREELTTEGGLDVKGQLDRVRQAVARLGSAGIRVSLFIDPDGQQIDAAAEAGAPAIEIHTGGYADAANSTDRDNEFEKIMASVKAGQALGLQVNAGHGLNYHNVQRIAAIPEIAELNIGHSIVARAVFSGFAQAVSDMKSLIATART